MPLYLVGDIWYIDIRTSRGRIRRSAGTSDKKEAQEYHDRIKGESWRIDKLQESPRVTWGTAVKKWLSLKPRDLTDRYRIRALEFGAFEYLPIPPKTVKDALPSSSPGAYNRVLALVIAIHNVAGVKLEGVERKPEPTHRTRWLTAVEWKRLKKSLEAHSPLLAQAAEFTLATGLRENNVLNLEWGQVDMGRRVAWIHADQAKAKVPIGVPLNNAAMAVLKARKGISEQYVFGEPEPLCRASITSWYSAVRDAGLKGFRWHDLRHTWASWHVMNGTRLEELMKLGGWSTMDMVMRYAHLSTEHMAGIAENVRPVNLKKGS